MTLPQKRSPQDTCLLCKTHLATKKNSHIVPKFWVKDMLITDDNQREGWLISTTPKNLNKTGQKVQDSPKQDYLFCPACEGKFGVLERYTANHFYNRFRDPAAAQDFPITRNQRPETDFITALKVDTIMFKLFMYSIIWRASISTDQVFKNFKLPGETEERLRELLHTFVMETEPATMAYIQQHATEFPHLPMNVITTEVAMNATANMVQPFIDPTVGNVLLFANEFIVIFYPDWNAPRQGGQAYNLADSPLTISVLSQQEWNQYHKALIKHIVDIMYRNLNR